MCQWVTPSQVRPSPSPWLDVIARVLTTGSETVLCVQTNPIPNASHPGPAGLVYKDWDAETQMLSFGGTSTQPFDAEM